MNIYVGNLSSETSAKQLREAFDPFGTVGRISLNENPHDDTAYRFCFVEMPYDKQAALAIKGLNGTVLGGNEMSIRESGVTI